MAKHCEYMQYLEHLKIKLENLENIIDTHRTIKEWAYIIHDKDVKANGEPKGAHIHLYLNFGQSSADFETVAKWFNDEPQYVSKVKKRKKDILKYLTHQNAPDKFQYNAENVKSNFNIEEAIEKEEKTDIDFIIRKISDGTIKEYNRFDYIDSVTLAKHNSVIHNAFKNRSEMIMRNQNRDIKVIFIYGTTGSGKTTYAKMLAEKIGDGSCYVSSSANDSLQDYKGQETVILDDLRDNAFEFADLLKALDNHTATSIRSRFCNKNFLGSTIIITSTVPILEWYKFSNEDKSQLRRRISNYLIADEKEICFYTFNPDNNYMPEFKYKIKNPVPAVVAKKTRDKQANDDILSICMGVLDGMDEEEKGDYVKEINEIKAH